MGFAKPSTQPIETTPQAEIVCKAWKDEHNKYEIGTVTWDPNSPVSVYRRDNNQVAIWGPLMYDAERFVDLKAAQAVIAASLKPRSELLPDSHRNLVVLLATKAMFDSENSSISKACHNIIRQFEGTDTRVIVERARPSGL